MVVARLLAQGEGDAGFRAGGLQQFRAQLLGQELVGIIAFREGWIDQLYVLPSWQRRGVGTSLLAIAQSRFLSLNVWTFQRNTAARRFYERHGFTLVKETDGFANGEKESDALYRWPSNH